jgi:hypothetical protein
MSMENMKYTEKCFPRSALWLSLQSEAMKERLLAAKKRNDGISLAESREKLGI